MDEPFSPLSQQAVPIEIIQGQTFTLPVTYLDDTGSIINLANFTAKMQVRVTAEAGEPPIVELSTENGLIVITPSLGLVQCTIPADVTSELDPGYAQYDLFIESASVSERLLFGEVKITERVTK